MQVVGYLFSLSMGSDMGLISHPTFPLRVVAAKSLASTGAFASCNMVWVTFHASDWEELVFDRVVWEQDCDGVRWGATDRFLEFLKKSVGFGLLFAGDIALHCYQCLENRHEAIGSCGMSSHGALKWDG